MLLPAVPERAAQQRPLRTARQRGTVPPATLPAVLASLDTIAIGNWYWIPGTSLVRLSPRAARLLRLPAGGVPIERVRSWLTTAEWRRLERACVIGRPVALRSAGPHTTPAGPPSAVMHVGTLPLGDRWAIVGVIPNPPLIAANGTAPAAPADTLTGLPGRQSVEAALASLLAGGDHGSIVILNVVGLGEVNTRYGHLVGDALLQQVAGRLLQTCGPDLLCSRWSGDEFLLVLPGYDRDDAVALATELRASVARPLLVQGHELHPEINAGLLSFPADGATVFEVLRRSEMALGRARSRRSGLELFSMNLELEREFRRDSMATLRQVLGRAALQVAYQPILSLSGDRVTGFEALVRWPLDHAPFLPTRDVIQLAEQAGLIHQLTQIVLERALAACRTWRALVPGLYVSVNLSPHVIADDRILASVELALRQAGLPPSALVLEVTETALIHDAEAARVTLEQQAALGVRLAIDDFGTGYASLAYLHQFPLALLKVDASFVAGLAASRSDQVIVRSTIGLAHELGLQVTAEGVEDPRSVDLLRGYGCDAVQGFLFGRPMPAGHVDPWLQQLPHRPPWPEPASRRDNQLMREDGPFGT